MSKNETSLNYEEILRSALDDKEREELIEACNNLLYKRKFKQLLYKKQGNPTWIALKTY